MDASKQIDMYVKEFADWRGDVLFSLRKIILSADSAIVEEWKWDVPVFTKNGMVCAISGFKDHVKINFFKGANLPDPLNLFNNGFTSKAHRSIDFKNGDTINVSALKKLVREAISLNGKK